MPSMQAKSPEAELDYCIKSYLIYLAHVKNSISLSIAEKSDHLRLAEETSNELFASAEKLGAKGINAFNKAEIQSHADTMVRRYTEVISSRLKELDKLLTIDASHPHSVKEAVESLALAGPNLVVLGRDKIDRFFSFRQFYRAAQDPLETMKKTASLREEDDKKFFELGLKTFRSMLLEPTHSNADRYFEAASLIDSRLAAQHDSSTGIGTADDHIKIGAIDHGACSVALDESNHRIDMRIAIDLAASNIGLAIDGFIESDGERNDFHIQQRYSRSLEGSVMNAYRLRRIFEVAKSGGKG